MCVFPKTAVALDPTVRSPPPTHTVLIISRLYEGQMGAVHTVGRSILRCGADVLPTVGTLIMPLSSNR